MTAKKSSVLKLRAVVVAAMRRADILIDHTSEYAWYTGMNTLPVL